jgi:hypothetical protein
MTYYYQKFLTVRLCGVSSYQMPANSMLIYSMCTPGTVISCYITYFTLQYLEIGQIKVSIFVIKAFKAKTFFSL